MPFASSQWVEQYFLPGAAIHVHAICAHFVGVFDMVSSSSFRLARSTKPNLSGWPLRSPEVAEFYSHSAIPGSAFLHF
jgi:hypothetical protein